MLIINHFIKIRNFIYYTNLGSSALSKLRNSGLSNALNVIIFPAIMSTILSVTSTCFFSAALYFPAASMNEVILVWSGCWILSLLSWNSLYSFAWCLFFKGKKTVLKRKSKLKRNYSFNYQVQFLFYAKKNYFANVSK